MMSHCAHFPAGVGIVEDPASGAANGLVAAYIAAAEPDGPLARGYTVSQGREIGHDAQFIVRIDADAKVWVGGQTQTVISGEVEWDAIPLTRRTCERALAIARSGLPEQGQSQTDNAQRQHSITICRFGLRNVIENLDQHSETVTMSAKSDQHESANKRRHQEHRDQVQKIQHERFLLDSDKMDGPSTAPVFQPDLQTLRVQFDIRSQQLEQCVPPTWCIHGPGAFDIERSESFLDALVALRLAMLRFGDRHHRVDLVEQVAAEALDIADPAVVGQEHRLRT